MTFLSNTWHEINFRCAFAHEIIDTALVFTCEPRKEIFPISFCGKFEILC
jgi:hypothetical protein